VKNAGHSEDDIVEELIRIKNGESWVGFNNLPHQFGLQRTVTMKVVKKLPSIDEDEEPKASSQCKESGRPSEN
jgi:hypothetical protein